MKGYTDFISGFGGFPQKPSHKDGIRYINWDDAEKFCLNHFDSTISAGLREDWNNTSGVIFSKGKWVDGYVFGGSRWATPILNIDDTDEEFECYSNVDKGFYLPKWWGRGETLISEYDLEDDEE